MKKKLLFIVLAIIHQIIVSQPVEIKLPPIWSIAKITFLVSDFQIARDYYGRFLGFEEALDVCSLSKGIYLIRVNNSPVKDKLVILSFKY